MYIKAQYFVLSISLPVLYFSASALTDSLLWSSLMIVYLRLLSLLSHSRTVSDPNMLVCSWLL